MCHVSLHYGASSKYVGAIDTAYSKYVGVVDTYLYTFLLVMLTR